MNVEKIAFITIGLSLLLSYMLLGGIAAPCYEIPTPKRDHPFELVMEEKIKKLSIDNFAFRVSDVGGYIKGDLLFPRCVFIHSKLKRMAIKEVETDFLPFFIKVIAAFNEIPEIRPYLKRFPIALNDVEIWLQYGPQPRSYYALPYYCSVCYLPYFKHLEFKRWEKPQVDCLGGQPALKKSFLEYPVLTELTHFKVARTYEEDITPIFTVKDIEKGTRRISINSLYPILKQMCKKYNLYISALRDCGLNFQLFKQISAGFWAHNQKVKLENARAFSYGFIDEYLHAILTKKVIEKSHRKDSEVFQHFGKNLNWFCFRITFWDEWLNRVEEPYIAQIQCEDGKIMYYTADEGQRLQLVFEEPIPERFFQK